MLHETVSDGKTVWVNDKYGCIGRFSKFGIDIHRSAEKQLKGEPECLDCTHVLPTLQDWLRFKHGMLNFHGIIVSDDAKPHFIGAH